MKKLNILKSWNTQYAYSFEKNSMESYRTLKILNFFLKAFSLHNISYENTLLVKPWPYLKVFVMLITFGSLSTYNLYLHYTSTHFTQASPSVVITDTVRAALGYFVYVIDLCFVYNYSNKVCDYYEIYDEMDLAVTMNYYKKIRHSVTTLVAVFTSSWLLASLGEYFVWATKLGWKSPTTYVTTYFMFLVRLLTVIDLNSQTLHIKYRLKTMTDKIQEFASLADDSSKCCKPVWNKRSSGNYIKTEVPSSILKCRNDVKKLNSYYLLLNDQTEFLNKFFGVRMLLYCLYTLVEMTTFVNIGVRLFTRSTRLFNNCLPIATSLLRFVNCVASLASLIYHCEDCCHQCNVVVSAIDNVLVNKKLDDHLRSSLTTLRRLVSSRPLRFHAAGFFKLDSTLLLSTASIVITYIIVILQSVP